MSEKFDATGRRVLDLDFGGLLEAFDALVLQVEALEAISAAGPSYAGKVAADGSPIALSSGWDSELVSTTYTVTHNLGFADGDAYALVLTAVENGAHANPQIIAQNADDFTVIVFNDENTGVTTVDWNFVLVPIG